MCDNPTGRREVFSCSFSFLSLFLSSVSCTKQFSSWSLDIEKETLRQGGKGGKQKRASETIENRKKKKFKSYVDVNENYV